jgi:NADH:ubiquinone oxidoreductase subunit C
MTNEEQIQHQLTAKFGFLDGKIRIQRERRIWVETPAESFDTVFSFIVKDMKFPILCTITGLDETQRLALVYHLAQEGGLTLNLKVGVSRENPKWKSVTPFFNGATLYEKELVDLLGIEFEGLPPCKRYPLTDEWPKDQHPLRKDWKPAGAATEKAEAI